MLDFKNVRSIDAGIINKSDITDAVEEAIHWAGQLGVYNPSNPEGGALFMFTFDGVHISVRADSNHQEIVSYYRLAKQNRTNRVDPYPLSTDESLYETGWAGLS